MKSGAQREGGNGGKPTHGSPRYPLARLNLAFGLIVVVGVAGVVRFLPLGSSPFPLNDGGLFARMASDLAAHGFALPAFTSYNGEAIPFAYPPLALYVVGLLGELWGGETIGVLHWLPAIISTASVIAMYAVAAELLRSPWRGLVAAAAFGLMPNSYIWLIVGGGVTRSLGLTLALIAIHQGVLIMRRHHWRHVLATAVFAGLTLLSHPQAAVFLAASLLTLLAFHAYRGRVARSVGQLAVAGVGAILIASPWWFAAVSTHGFPILFSAGRTGFDLRVGGEQLLGLTFADSDVFDLMTALGVLGLLLRIARRQWMIPAWLLLTILIDPRAGATYATVPLALSVVPVLGEMITRMLPTQGGATSLESTPLGALLRKHPAAVILALLVLFVALRTASRTAVDASTPLHGLQADHVAAMGWVRQHTDAGVAFVIVTGHTWESDFVSEWFPVLSQRTSIATVQGSEWRGFDAFLERLAQYRQLQRCSTKTAMCVDDWEHRWQLGPAYVFLPKGRIFGQSTAADCCPALRETMMASDRYLLVYDDRGASVFAPVDPT